LDLLKNGVKTRRDKSVWSHGSIEKLLTNTHYGGFYVVTDHKSGEVVRVECSPIVSSSLIRKAKIERESRTRQTRVSESNQKNFYLLRDFLFCSQCGARYSARHFPKQYRSVYYCPRIERNFINDKTGKEQKCLNRRYLKIEETDKLIWDSVVDVLSKSHQFKEEIKQQVLGENSLESQNDDLKKLRNKLKKVLTEISDVNNSIITLETDVILKRRNPIELKKILENVESARHKLESDKEELEQSIFAIQNRTKWVNWIGEFGDRINKMSEFTPQEKYQFLRGIIEKIQVKTIDSQQHELKIDFLVPYVEDSLALNNSKNKQKRYTVKKGKGSLVVPLETLKKSVNT
jgi:hypothetical protein